MTIFIAVVIVLMALLIGACNPKNNYPYEGED
jgi:predicted small secreted protein